MDKQRIVRLSNLVGIVAIVLLIYWVFIFISVEVFRFKVFRQNITETYYLSVFGILALMAGALIINIMMNLTILAGRVETVKAEVNPKKRSRILTIAVACSFPLIFGLLYTGDRLTARKKKNYLLNSAEQLINDYPDKTDNLLKYSFTRAYIDSTSSFLRVLSETEENFPGISIIVPDSIGKMKVFLNIGRYYDAEDTTGPHKKDFIYSASKEERAYLKMVFEEKTDKKRFNFYDGNYELYYPFIRGDEAVIFYIGAHQQYGKL